jgi:hypothetical protein
MKKFTAMLVGAFVWLLLGAFVWGKEQTIPRPRFENIYNEDHSGQFPAAFYVWHDKESGQEIVCTAGVYKGAIVSEQYHPSCWPTGRNWK